MFRFAQHDAAEPRRAWRCGRRVLAVCNCLHFKFFKVFSFSYATFEQGGGEGGIRTLEAVSHLLAFQASAFDHSATSPRFNQVSLDF